MKTGKLILQSVVFALLFVLVNYLIKTLRLRARFASILPGKSLGKLFERINESEVDMNAAAQAGCPTLGDIIEAKNNGCFSSLLPYFMWTSENMSDMTVTSATSTCFDPDTVLTENMCSLAVLELRNQIDLLFDLDMLTGLDDDPAQALMKGCYLDSELYAFMQDYYDPTDNGYLLGQFGYTEA